MSQKSHGLNNIWETDVNDFLVLNYQNLIEISEMNSVDAT